METPRARGDRDLFGFYRDLLRWLFLALSEPPPTFDSVTPYAAMARMLDTAQIRPNGRRGWLGLALQPITVPDAMRSVVGQPSGRMVVSLAPSGPAELAGLRPGDILLSLDGQSVSGAHALRAILGPERVGRQVEVRLVRNGHVVTHHLTIAPQPTD